MNQHRAPLYTPYARQLHSHADVIAEYAESVFAKKPGSWWVVGMDIQAAQNGTVLRRVGDQIVFASQVNKTFEDEDL